MTLYPKLTFDAEKDFTGIGIVANMATVMVRAPDTAAQIR